MQVLRVIGFLFCLGLAGCAGPSGGLGSVVKTNQLAPGMKSAEVKAVLGEPSQTQFISNKWIWKYSLHQTWKGFIPYYLVFNRDTQTLEQWFADEAEYAREQQMWLQAMPSNQKIELDVKVGPRFP
ncbi:hypothetical protein AEP_00812 [Curvibacter sp. AEP1-3]|uniref:hypothetical protein n=1 Tax=Curvibacter sp. AEP1-3 TaxID=1844971 RepID=UPI000B3C4C49|nr:hypothetical protein [Curvibacter sp. AEP1-3]ARV17771.1 hypothetical protein AEP_00812 [Curvibacter sp. AEP1-3]